MNPKATHPDGLKIVLNQIKDLESSVSTGLKAQSKEKYLAVKAEIEKKFVSLKDSVEGLP